MTRLQAFSALISVLAYSMHYQIHLVKLISFSLLFFSYPAKHAQCEVLFYRIHFTSRYAELITMHCLKSKHSWLLQNNKCEQ